MRPDTQTYFLRMARLAASRGTCLRRNVGCVLVDRYNRVIATGYNGVPSGFKHCNEEILEKRIWVDRESTIVRTFPHACEGAHSPSGTNLTGCKAIHAEANALISCRNPQDIVTAYCTASPCNQCVGYLLNTPCETVVFAEKYSHPEAEKTWTDQGRVWLQHSE